MFYAVLTAIIIVGLIYWMLEIILNNINEYFKYNKEKEEIEVNKKKLWGTFIPFLSIVGIYTFMYQIGFIG